MANFLGFVKDLLCLGEALRGAVEDHQVVECPGHVRFIGGGIGLGQPPVECEGLLNHLLRLDRCMRLLGGSGNMGTLE